MPWYLVHTKPRQESRALANLENQGYRCLLPMYGRERVRQRRLAVVEEPLFPRYLFIELMAESNWYPIRSTLGVSTLVRFGAHAAQVPDSVVRGLFERHLAQLTTQPRPLFAPGETVSIADGPFSGLQAVYEMADGDARAIVLIELLSRQVRLPVEVTQLRRAAPEDESLAAATG